jgi:flagellar biosynthesis protein FlhG
MYQTIPFPVPKRLSPAMDGGDGGAPARGGAEVIPLSSGKLHTPRVIAVTSGKGGVGKSFISANLGICLAQMGRRVLLLDADLGLANLDLMLGVSARATIREILNNQTPIQDVIVAGPSGVQLLAGCSGDYDMAELSQQQRINLFNEVDALEQRFDTLVVDTGAGIGSNAVGFAAAAQQVLVVVTPDPASMADAYAMIKVLNTRRGVNRIHLVVNQAAGPREADQIVDRLLDLVGRFLDVSVIPVGFIYRDSLVQKSVSRCEPLVSTHPRSAVANALQALARRVIEEKPSESAWGAPRLFWKRIMGLSEEGDNA